MSLDRLLQLHTSALVILGAVFVGQGSGTALVPGLAVLAAIAALTLTDVLGWFHLKRWMANLIVIAAVLWSLREFFEIPSEEKLIAIANMLCYMQMVLLFQEKSQRVYWQLVVLSMLQVVVAAALDLGPQFALLLGGYAVVALTTLLLLCIHRELVHATASSRKPAKSERTSPFLAQPRLGPAAITPEILLRLLPTRVLFRQVALISLVTFIFSIAFFYATPRMSENSWLAGKVRHGGGLGFQPEVRLEERGRIHLSNQVVMRAALTRMTDRRPLMLVGDPYFQGEVLIDYKYDERGGRWLPRQASATTSTGGGRWRSSSISLPTNVPLVRQDIVMEATTNSRRFAIQPNQAISEYPSTGYGWPRGVESESYVVPRHRRYSSGTPAISAGRQLSALPHSNRLLTLSDGVAFGEEEQRALAIEAERFAGLSQAAARVLKDDGLESSTLLNKALALERHFLVPGQYHYTLNLQFTRDPKLDPIEDFVVNHHTGHCEYFASALVLMLRSQSIPARMVWGYKGGAFNTVGQYYVVQQRHAHAWVEAWVPTDEVPRGELAGPPSEGGAWYRLDPTPSSEEMVVASEEGVASQAAQAFDYVELLWRDYVLSLNRNRQEDIVYDPLNSKMGMMPSWVDSRQLRRWLRSLSSELGLDSVFPTGRGGRPVFEPALAIVVVGGILGVVTMFGGFHFAAGVLRRWLAKRKPANPSRAPLFYRRLERVLARLPAHRVSGQTARELAGEAASQLAARGHGAEAAVPSELVGIYYRVRFGGDHLDKKETEAIEQALTQLSAAIAKR